MGRRAPGPAARLRLGPGRGDVARARAVEDVRELPAPRRREAAAEGVGLGEDGEPLGVVLELDGPVAGPLQNQQLEEVAPRQALVER